MLIGSTSFVRPSEEALQSGAVPFERAAVFYLSTPRWYYVRNETSGEDALYDRRQDLRGEHDVAADHGDLVLEFRERIDAWKTELRSAVDAET